MNLIEPIGWGPKPNSNPIGSIWKDSSWHTRGASKFYASFPKIAFWTPGDVFFVLIKLFFTLSYEVRLPRDIIAPGAKLKNGSWTGAIGQLQRKVCTRLLLLKLLDVFKISLSIKEVDMSVLTTSPTYEILQVIDMSYPVYFVDTSILIPFPEEEAKITILVTAFQWKV